MKGTGRALVLVLLLAVGALLASAGCTFWHADGGGPLTRAELGNWAGIPQTPQPTPQQLHRLSDRKSWPVIALGGGFSMVGDAVPLYVQPPCSPYNIPASPAPNHEIRVDFPTWKHFIPSSRRGFYLYVPRAESPQAAHTRTFCASERDWGGGLIVLDWLFRGSTANVFDCARGRRVSAESSLVLFGWGLGYNRRRQVVPVDATGRTGPDAYWPSDPGRPGGLYELRDGTSLLFGLVGWGRVNRTRYLQLFWVPISVGSAVR